MEKEHSLCLCYKFVPKILIAMHILLIPLKVLYDDDDDDLVGVDLVEYHNRNDSQKVVHNIACCANQQLTNSSAAKESLRSGSCTSKTCSLRMFVMERQYPGYQ